MIRIRQKVERKGIGFSVREWNPLLKEGFRTMGVFWRGNMLDKHFETSATNEYKYQKRTKIYMLRKAKKYGHQNPLEWSGTLHRMASSIEDVRSTSKAGTVVIHGPSYLYKFRKSQKQPDKAKELKTITRHESRALADAGDKKVTELANNTDRNKVTIINQS